MQQSRGRTHFKCVFAGRVCWRSAPLAAFLIPSLAAGTYMCFIMCCDLERRARARRDARGDSAPLPCNLSTRVCAYNFECMYARGARMHMRSSVRPTVPPAGRRSTCNYHTIYNVCVFVCVCVLVRRRVQHTIFPCVIHWIDYICFCAECTSTCKTMQMRTKQKHTHTLRT